jgi:hypothetical protein
MQSDYGGEYISNVLNDVELPRIVIDEPTTPYLPESTRITECFNQIINMIAYSITIAAPDLPCL